MFNRLARCVFALAIVAGALAAQDRYIVVREVAKSAATEVVTIQQPATGSRSVDIEAVSVQCDVSCAMVIDRDGTAATATPATPAKVNPATSPAASATAFVASDAGTGSVKLTPSYALAAGQIQTIDMHGTHLEGDGTTKNLNVRVGPLTGNVKIQVLFSEKR